MSLPFHYSTTKLPGLLLFYLFSSGAACPKPCRGLGTAGFSSTHGARLNQQNPVLLRITFYVPLCLHSFYSASDRLTSPNSSSDVFKTYCRMSYQPQPPLSPPFSSDNKPSPGHRMPNSPFPPAPGTPHHDPHGHTDIQGQPTTTLSILYPYSPPDLDGGSSSSNDYDKPTSFSLSSPPSTSPRQQQQPETTPRVVDVPVVFRDYNALETHYTEVPLSVVNPEQPPADHYLASSNPLDRKSTPDAFGDAFPPSSGVKQEDFAKGKIKAETEASHGEAGESNVASLSQSRQTKKEEESGEEILKVVKGANDDVLEVKMEAKGGVVGGLANLRLDSGTGHVMDDRERRLQWEHGQADYMGVDRFDNIRARLDASMSGPDPQDENNSAKKPEPKEDSSK